MRGPFRGERAPERMRVFETTKRIRRNLTRFWESHIRDGLDSLGRGSRFERAPRGAGKRKITPPDRLAAVNLAAVPNKDIAVGKGFDKLALNRNATRHADRLVHHGSTLWISLLVRMNLREDALSVTVNS